MHGKDQKKLAQVYKETGNLTEAMLAAGYSPKVARQGKHKLSKASWAALADEKIKIGKTLSAEDRAAYVRGGLMENTLAGKDQAVKSYELLGKDKEVQMFTADSQIGVIVLQAPQDLNVHAAIKEPPVIQAPVDLEENG
jgi:phage terminase small subunit